MGRNSRMFLTSQKALLHNTSIGSLKKIRLVTGTQFFLCSYQKVPPQPT